jgi:hypothetical protein
MVLSVGNNYAAIASGSAAAASGTGTLWGNTNVGVQNPTQFPAAGKLVTQVAVYLDPTAAAFTSNGETFGCSVALNKNGATAVLSRDYYFTLGW